MRFATFAAAGKRHFGVIVTGGAISLSAAFPEWSTLRQVIAAGGLGRLAEAARDCAVSHPDGEFQFDIPVPDPEKILCVGVNYPGRNEEYRKQRDALPNMSLFPRFPRSFTGHARPLIRPPESAMFDYEGEIAVVIGKGGRRIDAKVALDHIAALTLCNDGTLRDWTRHARFNVTQGKNFDRSGALGPWLVPFRSRDQILDVRLTTRVNGDLRQDDRTGRMLFPVARQIEYISTFTTLVPGDIIVTGTPTGAGARFDPPRYLQAGDVVEIEAEGIGILRNVVVDEHAVS